MEEKIEDESLWYIFVNEDLGSWAEKFSKQEKEESKGKKIIHVIKMLSQSTYQEKNNQRKKSRKDPNFNNIFFEINKDEDDHSEKLNSIIRNIEDKLKTKLKNEGDKVKNWALSNKFAQKAKKKTNTHYYIHTEYSDKLA